MGANGKPSAEISVKMLSQKSANAENNVKLLSEGNIMEYIRKRGGLLKQIKRKRDKRQREAEKNAKLLSERGFEANNRQGKTKRRRGTSMGRILAQYSRIEAMRRIRQIMLGRGLAQSELTFGDFWRRITSGKKKSLAQSKNYWQDLRRQYGNKLILD